MGTTYNGVNGAQGGNIFKDVKFWVAQRVPLRSTWIDDIKQNGGLVVPLEKHADMLIADHKRKDVPPGSYSWKFIEDSVKHGIAQVKDKYLIGPDPELPRPVGARFGAKKTRTPFTKADDANLAKWVLSQKTYQLGNAIYQEYEKINPRHTFQSWRDRFVKYLQPRGMAALEQLAAQATELPVSEPTAPAPSPRVTTERRPAARRPEPQAARVPAEPQSVRRPEPQPVRQPEPQSVRQPRPQANTGPERAPERPQAQSRPAPVPEEDPRRQRFYDDLNEYKEVSGAEIKDRVNINGRFIDLFDIAAVVNECQLESQMLDWCLIAEKLKFEDPNDDIAAQLDVCYAEYLAPFLAAMASFDPETEGDMEAEIGGLEEEPFDQGMPEQGDSQWPASYVPSSPPVAVGRKRSAGQRQLSAGHATKRPRYDKDMVIPSTPDADMDADLPPVENSPTVRKSSQWRAYVDESEASQHLPPLPPLQAESQDLGTGQSPTPVAKRQPIATTQEYQQEALDPTPIPFSLKRTREQKASASREAPRAEPPRTSLEGSSRNGVSRHTPRQAAPASNTKPTGQSAPRRSLPASFTSSRDSLSRLTTTAPPRAEPPQRSDQPESPKSNRREIQKWTTFYESQGFPHHIVVEALKRTTLTPGSLALQVMESLQDGNGVPSHHEGIWTDRDDDDLAFVSEVDFSHTPTTADEERQQHLAQRAHNRLVGKHTFQRFELRKAFLRAQADQGNINE